MAFRANMNSQFAKTKMCKFELIGCCMKGESCQFAHQASQLQPLPDLSRTKLCPTFIQKGHCDVVGCTFAHGKVEIRATNAFHKTKMCRFFPSGRCERGSQCTFAHASIELKEPAVQVPDVISTPEACPEPRAQIDGLRNDRKANAKANTLTASLTRDDTDNLVPAISLLLERLGDIQVPLGVANKLTPGLSTEMMEAETSTQYSDSQVEGHTEGTSTPTTSEDDQLIGEAMNAHHSCKTIQLFPFVAQKPEVQDMPFSPPPGLDLPPGLQLYNENGAVHANGMRVQSQKHGSALRPNKTHGMVNHPDNFWRTVNVVKDNDIWDAENLFSDL